MRHGSADYPWSTPYPFPFALEPLTLDSLAKYVYGSLPVTGTERSRMRFSGMVA